MLLLIPLNLKVTFQYTLQNRPPLPHSIKINHLLTYDNGLAIVQ